jgi:hypothetical protein
VSGLQRSENRLSRQGTFARKIEEKVILFEMRKEWNVSILCHSRSLNALTSLYCVILVLLMR